MMMGLLEVVSRSAFTAHGMRTRICWIVASNFPWYHLPNPFLTACTDTRCYNPNANALLARAEFNLKNAILFPCKIHFHSGVPGCCF
jgi:hypothetical protein